MALVPCPKSEPRVEFPLHTLDSLAGCLVIIHALLWEPGVVALVGADPPPRLDGERPRAAPHAAAQLPRTRYRSASLLREFMRELVHS